MHTSPAEAPASNGTLIVQVDGQEIGKITEWSPAQTRGLIYVPEFVKEGADPYAGIVWTKRDIKITNSEGVAVFEQNDVEAPSTWSDNAVTIVSSKYFRGKVGSEERETSVRQVIDRVVTQIAYWADQGHYFASDADITMFCNDLTYLLVNQMAAFNSPVWFNLGWDGRKQATSACYINSVEDDMGSILDLVKTEGMLFKDGSGSGINLSTLRSKLEFLAAGGKSSGPVSFMRGYDAFAGVIKSAGSTRRAACMRVLNVDHLDVEEFIDCKADTERMAHALIDAGFSGEFNDPNSVYANLPFQNANHSVRVSDAFMNAVVADEEWTLHGVKDFSITKTVRARDLYRKIAEAAHFCGDPGIQFDSTTNKWHTCKDSGRINASNPCSEYVFLDNTACNLASLNLMKFLDASGTFQAYTFANACRAIILAQEIFVSFSDYPTAKIRDMSHAYRPLGIGYSNLGALLMHKGLAYDSDAGRDLAASITSLMSGSAYAMSGEIAQKCGGSFAGFDMNAGPMVGVLAAHGEANYALATDSEVISEAQEIAKIAGNFWDEAFYSADDLHCMRNGQISVIAPTGTISFMMDCDTTGIEPCLALVAFKKLVGGGTMKIAHQGVRAALKNLGYASMTIDMFIRQLEDLGEFDGLEDEDLPVFDCALPSPSGRSIDPMGHVRMMAAVQSFISGAISKTVNMPSSATVEDIERIYLEAWKRGLKCIAIYRDGCKRSQPMNTKKESEATPAPEILPTQPVRHKLPATRKSVTHRFSVGGVDGYFTIGLYEDGSPGEMFVTISKEGSTISGLMDAFATSISIGLQYGVPLNVLADKFSYTRFEPSGFTGDPDVPMAHSLVDYIFRWMRAYFDGQVKIADPAPVSEVRPDLSSSAPKLAPDAPTCRTCGSITVRSGSCNACPRCGSTSGCS